MNKSLSPQEERERKVFERNDFIRNGAYKLTQQEKKVFEYLVSLIGPYDKPEKVYTANIRDICRACNFNFEDTREYTSFMRDLIQDGLTTTLGWIKVNGASHQLALLYNDAVVKDDGTAVFRFHSLMYDYLFNLKRDFTGYQLLNILCLHSKYSIDLFRILKSYESEGECTLILSELKEMLNLSPDQYSNYYDFDKRILKPSQEEINNYCRDFHFTYEVAERAKRKVYSIRFVITANNPREERTKTNETNRNERMKPKRYGKAADTKK